MATDISGPMTSALSVHPVIHPAVENHRAAPPPPLPVQEEEHRVEPARHEIQKLLAEMNDVTKVMNTRLRFFIDQDTKDVIVKVIDTDTDKVIKELPPAELVKLHKSIKETLGILIDKLI